MQTVPGVKFLLLGGFDREIDYRPLIEYLVQHPVEHVLYTGKAGNRMHQMLCEAGYKGDTALFNNLEEAFDIIRKKAAKGDVVLLSPAAASYDQYKNFEERGSKFKEFARKF